MSIYVSDRRFETFKMLQKLIDIFTLNNGKHLKRIRQELTEISMLTVVHSEQGGRRGRGLTPDVCRGHNTVAGDDYIMYTIYYYYFTNYIVS